MVRPGSYRHYFFYDTHEFINNDFHEQNILVQEASSFQIVRRIPRASSMYPLHLHRSWRWKWNVHLDVIGHIRCPFGRSHGNLHHRPGHLCEKNTYWITYLPIIYESKPWKTIGYSRIPYPSCNSFLPTCSHSLTTMVSMMPPNVIWTRATNTSVKVADVSQVSSSLHP